jgi:hypothetical protein
LIFVKARFVSEPRDSKATGFGEREPRHISFFFHFLEISNESPRLAWDR